MLTFSALAYEEKFTNITSEEYDKVGAEVYANFETLTDATC